MNELAAVTDFGGSTDLQLYFETRCRWAVLEFLTAATQVLHECLHTHGFGSISAPSRHRRRQVYCMGIGVPVLKMSASPRRSSCRFYTSACTRIHACTHAQAMEEIRATPLQALIAEGKAMTALMFEGRVAYIVMAYIVMA